MSTTFNDKVEINNASDFTFIHGEADEDFVLIPFDMSFARSAFFSLRPKFICNGLIVIYQELLAS